MARGGARPNAGRKAGSVTQKTREVAERAADEGITPLEYMLERMRDEAEDKAVRLDAAKSAAPYIHAKLSAVELDANVTTKTLAQELAELNAQSDAESD